METHPFVGKQCGTCSTKSLPFTKQNAAESRPRAGARDSWHANPLTESGAAVFTHPNGFQPITHYCCFATLDFLQKIPKQDALANTSYSEDSKRTAGSIFLKASITAKSVLTG